MKQKKEDEIMAEYLLKGGKMLEKTCRQCGCPQFEYKGKTFCVVCAERGQERKSSSSSAGQKSAPARRSSSTPVEDTAMNVAGCDADIASELAATILDLCRRIKEEEDPDRCRTFMDAVKIGTESLQILRQL